jgi:hypothetical protein
MAKLIRYTLAAICLAASVGCMALWWRSLTTLDRTTGPCFGGLLLKASTDHGAACTVWYDTLRYTQCGGIGSHAAAEGQSRTSADLTQRDVRDDRAVAGQACALFQRPATAMRSTHRSTSASRINFPAAL